MRVPHSLQWRIALAYTALIFFSMGAVSLYLVNFVRNSYLSDLQVRLEQEAALVAETTAQYFPPPVDLDRLQAAVKRMGDKVDSRVTVIAKDGAVLADTWDDPRVMENHAGRPEVQGALRNGISESTRVSATVGQEMLYTAVPIQADGVLVGVARVAVPTSKIQANIGRIIATVLLSSLVVALLSIALSYFLASRTSKSVRSLTEGARRLASGELEHRVRALAADETEELADAFNTMAAALRRMIRDLSDERNKLLAVLETMADGVVVVGRDGDIILMNRATEDILGVKAQQATGSRFISVVRDHDLQQLVSASRESREQHRGQAEVLHPRRFLSAIATPLVDNGAVGVLLTLHDLTGLRQIDTTRKEFVSNVSHELRSPLAAVKAMVETLEDGALQDRDAAQDFLHRIHREVDRMNSIVDDLLELARLESGQVTLHTTPIDLVPLVEEVKSHFQAQAQAKGVTLEVVLPGALPLVESEADKLRRALVNLIDNAIKFTRENGRVTLSAAALEDMVEIRVSDTGVGIAPEHLPHVFERFYKVDRARRDGGTGLGLAIVKHIVQAQGGDVRVDSQEGVGTTFTITVPQAG